ncbi:hypothetical protein SAMN05428949_7165 [Chitinophaga sp. YR627]|uniref:hypothetical protein n=1 Tax=Chitinophaga sp. YR627 TaxID=1881041 RepID=UPI0008E3B414|nr:hypothetical protein [Chitinophaga sp. YR627]SFP01120.1 hypothetical protein SAMN05428949_7165 [Chitinophaga sp. YR627]
MKQAFVACVFLLFTACHSNSVNNDQSDTAAAQVEQDTLTYDNVTREPINITDSSFFKINDQFPWMGDTIRSYIQLSTNEMVKSYLRDSSIVFMYDGFEHTDIGNCVRVQLGADVNNGEGMIFSTAQWIYVDTLSRAIYEYDIAADSSHLWVRPQ